MFHGFGDTEILGLMHFLGAVNPRVDWQRKLPARALPRLLPAQPPVERGRPRPPRRDWSHAANPGLTGTALLARTLEWIERFGVAGFDALVLP